MNKQGRGQGCAMGRVVCQGSLALCSHGCASVQPGMPTKRYLQCAHEELGQLPEASFSLGTSAYLWLMPPVSSCELPVGNIASLLACWRMRRVMGRIGKAAFERPDYYGLRGVERYWFASWGDVGNDGRAMWQSASAACTYCTAIMPRGLASVLCPLVPPPTCVSVQYCHVPAMCMLLLRFEFQQPSACSMWRNLGTDGVRL